MPFVKNDPRINRAGRIDKKEKPTKRSLKEIELLMLLRKIKPHVAESIMTAAKIMKNEKAPETSRLKAATILLENYRRLSLDLYDGEEDDESPAVQPSEETALFSLKVIDSDNKE